nr:MAG TPA: hypothetical protein [Bacteriophage sp.]
MLVVQVVSITNVSMSHTKNTVAIMVISNLMSVIFRLVIVGSLL